MFCYQLNCFYVFLELRCCDENCPAAGFRFRASSQIGTTRCRSFEDKGQRDNRAIKFEPLQVRERIGCIVQRAEIPVGSIDLSF